MLFIMQMEKLLSLLAISACYKCKGFHYINHNDSQHYRKESVSRYNINDLQCCTFVSVW
jgi:hypothetical protein